MKLVSKQSARLAEIAALVLLAAASSAAQQAEKSPMVEDVFKNVQVMKGIPVNEFMETMGFFAAALGLNCTGCHVAESLQDQSKFADDVPRKRMSRAMITMVNNFNKTGFGGRRALTCWTCHRGTQVPENVPSLTAQYTVAPEDPDTVEISPDGPKEPTADQILDKYLQAVGGAAAAANLKSFLAKGTIEGYDTYHVKVPVELYAKSPNQRTMIWHTQNGDSSTVFDGKAGWIAMVNNPVRLIPALPGGELDGAKLDGDLCFPANIKAALKNWRVGFPVTTIDDKPVNIVQGNGAGNTRVKLFFDADSGLLVRQLRYDDTVVGQVPVQVDYGDYRAVAGVKVPYNIVVTWTDNQQKINFTEIQANVAMDAARFAKPAPAVLKAVGKAR
jgi:photosynthetic reaction center cytochrome c subunit